MFPFGSCTCGDAIVSGAVGTNCVSLFVWGRVGDGESMGCFGLIDWTPAAAVRVFR